MHEPRRALAQAALPELYPHQRPGLALCPSLLSLSLCRALFLYVALSLSPSFFFSLSRSLSLAPSLFPYLTLSVSLSFSLPLLMSTSLSLSFSLSVVPGHQCDFLGHEIALVGCVKRGVAECSRTPKPALNTEINPKPSAEIRV